MLTSLFFADAQSFDGKIVIEVGAGRAVFSTSFLKTFSKRV